MMMQMEKLEGAGNWTKWRRQAELLLRHHEVLDLITGEYTQPVAPVVLDSTSRSTYETALKAYKKSDALAQLILVSNMNDANIDLTATCETVKAIWDKLLSVYEQSSGQRVDRLMEQFLSSEKIPTEDISTHIARLQRNIRELNDELKRLVKTELPNLLLMSRILSTLPAEYFEFKSVWESESLEERTLNKLTERLRLTEMRLPEKHNESTALVATFDKKNFRQARKAKAAEKLETSERKCFKCHQVGHFAKNCPASTSGGSYKGIMKPTGDAFLYTSGNRPADDDGSDIWLADSGASAHDAS